MAESNAHTSTTSDNDLILVKDRYKIIKVLGRGSYGEVWLVSPLESSIGSKSKPRRCVLKRICIGRPNNEKNELAAAEREAQLLSSLKHPNIVAYIESFRSRDHYLNIVMAFCEGGDLYTKLKYRKKQLLNEEQIIEWFIQITLALQYMHERSILHRDLKTQNIFLTKHEIVKVGDLGIAKILDNNGADLATTVIGTPYYMSPEIFSNQPYGQKSDIWALGCCVYEMATLEHAFKAGDISSLVLKVVRGQTPSLPSADVYSKPLIELINAMLDKDADNRPTAKQILQHPYIKQHIVRLYDKTRERCQSYTPTPSTEPSLFATPLHDADSHSMPPTPKPRSANLPRTDNDINEKQPPSTPPISQPRARRLKQKTTLTNNEISELSKPIISVSNEDEEKEKNIINNSFIEKIRQNDTLARFKRNSSSPSQSDDNSIPRANIAARQRRREHRVNSAANPSEDDNKPPTTPPVYDRSISNDSQIDTVEQERKAKKDMNDFLHQLDATLRLPASSSTSIEVPSMSDRTMITTFKLEERRDALKENCLQEMSPEELKQVLDILDLVSETEIKKQMINILGEDIYEKYCAQIYSLKYYENSIFTRQ
ncbi:unnamed protein product [Rotaria sp. Silwood2]|nr:unnamed protein product [Rotaria sp. Silwood2]CAF2606561.1 unnamed protein product [Rotaria sp. Silwood2]CAF3020730.1 unnamed protein product [Rotaria sp. Silwood2]CAF3943275.1 unnamed protein product [Rotaria sp. Silwood2]CAF4157963.1 unnamed protein product [Rotaria sp. Silwood2]